MIHTIKNREGKEIVNLSMSWCDELNAKGLHQKLYVLGNERSRAVKYYITSERTNI